MIISGVGKLARNTPKLGKIIALCEAPGGALGYDITIEIMQISNKYLNSKRYK